MSQRLREPQGSVVLIALLAIVASVVGTIRLTIEAADTSTFSEDVLVSRWVQNVSLPGIDLLVAFLTWAGKPIPLAVLTGMVAVALLARGRLAESILVLPSTFSHVINYALKDVVESPRPSEHHVRVIDQAAGFGFPSGHTMAVVVFCGVIAYLAWRLIDHTHLRFAVWGSAGLAVIGMGFSRIYSGAHWPSDVLGGILWGTFYTILLVLIFHRLKPAERAEQTA